MKRRELSGTSTARAVIALLEKVYKPQELVKALRPAELDYLCEVCLVLDELKICEDLWMEQDAPDEEDE